MQPTVQNSSPFPMQLSAELTDGQLLERFIVHRDQHAFADLVRRHASMVFSVCRRVAGSHHDAEDAFQAAFLVLARQPRKVRPPEQVGNWLFGVAYRTAQKARAQAARRHTREKQVTVMPDSAVQPQEIWRDLQPVLDEEINRLPAKYRSAIVLCDLEGRTYREAARQLDLPEGTLSNHLARGREMLMGRLARRGVSLSVGTLAAALAQEAAATAPEALLHTAIQAGNVLTAGVASVQATALADGVVKAMLWAKLKAVVLTATAVVAVFAAGGIYVRVAAPPTELQAAMAEADELDPGWRIDDLEAQRPKVPDEENAAHQVLLLQRPLI